MTVIMLAAAACGDDDDSAQSDAEGQTPTSEAPTGEPIKVMTIGTLGTAEGATTSIEQVGVAYEGWINSRGGLDGRPLEVIFCNDQDDPNGAAECGREAVEKQVVAVVGGYSLQGGDDVLAILEGANIPWLGLGMFGFGAQTSPMSFPTIGGSTTEWVAIGQEAGTQGCKVAGQMRWDAPSGLVSSDWFRHGLETEGGEVGPVAPVGFTATDMAPAVAVATDGVDCVSFGMSPEQGPLVVQAIQQAGITDVTLAFYPDAVTEQAVEETGGAESPAEGGISASWFPVAHDPIWDEAKAAVEEFASDPDVVHFTDNFNFQLTWVAYKTFESVINGLETTEGLDGATLVAALNEAQNVDTGGFTPPLQWQTPVVQDDFAYSRIFNPNVVLLTIKDGQYAHNGDGEFVDVTDLMLSYEETPGLLEGVS